VIVEVCVRPRSGSFKSFSIAGYNTDESNVAQALSSYIGCDYYMGFGGAVLLCTCRYLWVFPGVSITMLGV